jgi:hypothetical protein
MIPTRTDIEDAQASIRAELERIHSRIPPESELAHSAVATYLEALKDEPPDSGPAPLRLVR